MSSKEYDELSKEIERLQDIIHNVLKFHNQAIEKLNDEVARLQGEIHGKERTKTN